MKRLTERDEYGNADIIGVDSAALQLNLDFDEFVKVTDALNRLAAYEDTGLMPEEITKLVQFREQVMNGELLSIPGVSIRRLSELSEAERDGRLVVLPCMD